MKRRIGILIIVSVALLAGCDSGRQQRPWKTLDECERANTDLSMQVETLQDENNRLNEQVATLAKLKSDERFAAINTVEKIRIGKRSGFYDKDDDGTNETLVVYLQPLDTAQDTIKAVGKVEIGLWYLDDPDNAFVESWEVVPEILHTTWGGNIFNSYYRLEFIPKHTLQQGKEFTVKASFTDYISGKVLTDQKVITP